MLSKIEIHTETHIDVCWVPLGEHAVDGICSNIVLLLKEISCCRRQIFNVPVKFGLMMTRRFM